MCTQIIPRCPISIRTATTDDLPFIDSLQKMHTHMVGWMPTSALEGKIKLGHVIIAEDESKQSVGYCIGNDQYFKRDDVGIVYQLNVLPTKHRGLIGATLIKAMFERAAYGCKLFCCWCAQDIEANYFWESLGFIPLAFRSGSRGRSARGQMARTHIFWQRRIREGDMTTPYWFPAQTSAGSIREDRLVLPIPPGTHWSDAKPILLPTAGVLPESKDEGRRLKDERKKRSSLILHPSSLPAKRRAITATSGLQFGVAKDSVSEKKRAKKPREPKRKVKNDPKLIAAARELRDRWLEQFNSGMVLPAGKYEVSRQVGLEAKQPTQPATTVASIVPALPAPTARVARAARVAA